MKRSFILPPVILLAAAAAGCQTGPESDDNAVAREPIERVDVGTTVLSSAEDTHYEGQIKLWRDGKVKDYLPSPKLAMKVAADGDQRLISVDSSDERLRGRYYAHADGVLAPTRVDGKANVSADARPPGLDLLDQLPHAGVALEQGKSFHSAPVDEALVRANAARGQLTMVQRVESTPSQIFDVGDLTLVRLETRAVNVLSWINEAGALRSGDMGVSYYGFTDLVRLSDDSWRVRAIHRVMPIDNTTAPGSYDELAAIDHLEFTACLTASSRVDARKLHRAAAPGVDAFSQCN